MSSPPIVGAVRTLVVIVGIAIVVGVTSSVLRTLVVPRVLRSKLTESALWLTLVPFRWLARRLNHYETRDRILAWAGPLSIVVTLLVWIAGYLVGYATILYGLSAMDPTTALREAGSSLLTLGFASTDRNQLTAVDFLAAATGPIVIGLLIGYLATVYSAYNRRETEVTRLESRAGEPNWGPEILARHANIGAEVNLDDLFLDWERWAADLSESHTNYPVLVWIRSARPWRHWLIGQVAVMDAAALRLALTPSLPQGRPRICLRMGFVALRDIAKVQGLVFDPDPSPDDPIRLTYEEFAAGVQRATSRGYVAERTAEQAWPHFRGWRVNYEAIAYGLSELLDAPPALWSGSRHGQMNQVPPNAPVNRQPGEGPKPAR
jgi:hypothetical protein